MAKGGMEVLLNKEEISKATGLSVSFIERAMEDKAFPFYKLGRNVRFRISEVEKWIAQRKRAG